ncbi:rRNA maturation RNase YbeY [Chloroflexota bacterium]
MNINVLIDKEIKGCPESSWLQSIAEHALIAQGVSSNTELGLVIASQKRVQELNRDYLGKDRPTDVLAFAMLPAEEKPVPDVTLFATPPDGMLHLGEVIISYPQAVIQAEERQHSVRKELAIIIIHGVLHLLGFDDENPELKKQMAAREKAILNSTVIE